MSGAALSIAVESADGRPVDPCRSLKKEIAMWLHQQVSLLRDFPHQHPNYFLQSGHGGDVEMRFENPRMVLARVTIANAACDRVERCLRTLGYHCARTTPVTGPDLFAAELRLRRSLDFMCALLPDSATASFSRTIPDQVPAPVRKLDDRLQAHAWLLIDAQRVTQASALDLFARIVQFNSASCEDLATDFVAWVAREPGAIPAIELDELSASLSCALWVSGDVASCIAEMNVYGNNHEVAGEIIHGLLQQLKRTIKMVEGVLLGCGISSGMMGIRELTIRETLLEPTDGPPCGPTPLAVPVPWPEVMSAKELAKLLRTPEDATRKKLERLDEKYCCRFEDEDLGILYRTRPIRAEMEDWVARRKRP
jgi:hypothetical protein